MHQNNIFILGKSGENKKQLFTELLNKYDLKDKILFIHGDLENPNLDYENVDNAAGWSITTPMKDFVPNRESHTDLFALEFDRKKMPDKEVLVIIEEAHLMADSFIQKVSEDLRAKKITLWMAEESFITLSQHWNLDILNDFNEFYFFRSQSSEDFLNESAIRMMDNLQPGSEKHLHFSVTPEKPIKTFFSEQFQNLLEKDAEGKPFLMPIRG